MIVFFRILCIIIGYFIGCVSPSYFIAKSKGIDIKSEGSGNAGTTNTLRVLGKKAGIIVFLLDLIKAIVAGIVCLFLFDALDGDEVNNQLYLVYSAAGVILGHCFPFYLHFDGGKGVAATFGAMLIIDWRVTLIAFAIFIIIVLITKYVSLGSILSSAAYFIGFTLLALNEKLILKDHSVEAIIVVGLIIAFLIFNHRTNIKRLLAGNENKIGSKKE